MNRDAERLVELMVEVARTLLEEETRKVFGPLAEVPAELLARLPVDYARLVSEISAERVAELMAMDEATLRVLLRQVASDDEHPS